MSPLQLVLVGTVMEVSIFVFEVPTGHRRRHLLATALDRDRHGRDGRRGDPRSAPSATPWPILAADALWGFGYTFTSGALRRLARRRGRRGAPGRHLPARRPGGPRRRARSGSARASASHSSTSGCRSSPPASERSCSPLFFALSRCPRRGSLPLPREERGSFAQMAHTGAPGRAPRAGPAGAARDPRHRGLRGHVERGLRPPLAGALPARRRPPVARRSRPGRLVRRLRRRHRSCSRSPSPTRSASGSSMRRCSALADDAVLARRVAARERPRLRPRRAVLARPRRLLRRRRSPGTWRARSSQTWLNRNVERLGRAGDRALDHEPGRRGRPVDRRAGDRADRQRVLDPGRARRRRALHGAGARRSTGGPPGTAARSPTLEDLAAARGLTRASSGLPGARPSRRVLGLTPGAEATAGG